MSDVTGEELADALGCIQRYARVGVHFHPDRPDSAGATVAECLLRDGRYRSQFETGLSNGGLSAHVGGRRDVCEQRLFGDAYHSPQAPPAERPKYGALVLLRHADGPSPRFGSCYFLLAAEVSRRCTFTYLDSHAEPLARGTLEEFEHVFSVLLAQVFNHEFGLGESELRVPGLLRRLRSELSLPLAAPAGQPVVRNLNHYVEAQLHGELVLERDVEALVADPSFRGAETGRVLEALCERYSLELCWHPGFVLASSDVPRDFRGATMPSLAERVARAGLVDACAIGSAVRDLRAHPAAWRDRGSYDEVLQELKLLWHVLVKFGRPL